MKKKIDFVTNSSSVSFIIAGAKNQNLKVPLEIEVDLSEFVTETFSDKELFKNYWLQEFCGEETDDEYLKCQSMIDDGKTVYFLHCSDEDQHVEALLCNTGLDNLKLPDNIKIIQGEGGY